MTDVVALAKAQTEYSSMMLSAMAVEEKLLAEGKLVESAYRSRDLSDWACRVGTVVYEGDRQLIVTKQIIDVLDPATNQTVVIGAGVDIEMAMRKVLACKPFLHPPGPASDLAEQAFGAAPTLKAQKMFLETEVLGNVEAARAEARKWGTELGSLKPGTRPGPETKKLPPAADAIRKNPWLLKNDDPKAQERRVSVIKGLGTKVAAELAKAAGVDLAGRSLR